MRLTTFSSDKTCSARCFLKSSILKFPMRSDVRTVGLTKDKIKSKSEYRMMKIQSKKQVGWWYCRCVPR